MHTTARCVGYAANVRQFSDAFVAVLVVTLIGPCEYSRPRAAVFGAPSAPRSTIDHVRADGRPVAAESANLQIEQLRAAARSTVTPAVVATDRSAPPNV